MIFSKSPLPPGNGAASSGERVWRESRGWAATIVRITCAGGADHPQGAAPAPPLPPTQARAGAEDPAATSADDAADAVISNRNFLW